MNMRTKFEVRSFTRSWDNRGYFKTLGTPYGYAHDPISPKFLMGFCLNGHGKCNEEFEVRGFTLS